MRLPAKTLRWLPFCAALLTGCDLAPRLGLTEIRIERPKIDPALLTCRDEPAPPADGTQRDAAAFIVDLREAGADCRANLAGVRAALAPPPPPAQDAR